MNKSGRWASPVFLGPRTLVRTWALVPGHWEGDLIIGKGKLSQVGTLAKRTSLFVAFDDFSMQAADAGLMRLVRSEPNECNSSPCS